MRRLIGPGYGGKKKSSDYPKNWGKISEEFRKRHNYTCAVCGVDCSNIKHKGLIDVHHKNGVKSDCKERNLQCLCKFHHFKQPSHSHYKPKPDDMELLHKLWEEQKTPMEKRESKSITLFAG